MTDSRLTADATHKKPMSTHARVCDPNFARRRAKIGGSQFPND